MCRIMCKERGAEFFCPSRDLLVDNGAMIAYLGEILFSKGLFGKDELEVKPRERTDDIKITWR